MHSSSFDPLSFFSAEPNSEFKHDDNMTFLPTKEQSVNMPETDEIDEDLTTPKLLHPLDLPTPSQIPSFEIIHTILLLLRPLQQTNFGESSNLDVTADSLPAFLRQKSISAEQFQNLQDFFSNSSIQTIVSITKFNELYPKELINYLTNLIANALSSFNDEQRETIYSMSSNIMTQNSGPALKGDTTRKIIIPGLQKSILLKEPGMTGDNIGFLTWGASFMLSKRLVKDFDFYVKSKEKFFLELGSGTGLVSIALGLSGKKGVATDLEEIVGNLKENINLNLIGKNVDCEILDWRNCDNFLKQVHRLNGFETVLLSDPIYSDQHPYWVKDVLTSVLSKNKNMRVMFEVGKRDRFENIRSLMWNLLDEMGLIEVFGELEDGYDDYGSQQFFFKVFAWKNSISLELV